jgi:MFS family permease
MLAAFATARHPMSESRRPTVFSNRSFTLLVSGSFVSMLGDQFTLIALPWLVLQLTGDPAALGAVLAMMALPRAAFMLIGGAVVDRLSPRRVLLVARGANALLIALLAAGVLTGMLHMASLYVLALLIGLATAFVYPAGSAILPQLVDSDQLGAANSFTMGLRQLSMFIGPALAGGVIALMAGRPETGQAVDDARGIGIAFVVDAVSFLFSLGTLMLIRIRADHEPPRAATGVLKSVAEGIGTIWRDLPLRAFVLYIGAVAIFVAGPVQVGLPVLAKTRLDGGAASFGILMTAHGGGILVGTALSGIFARRLTPWLGRLVLMLDSLAGLGLATLALVHHTTTGAALMVLMGAFAGFVQVAVFTWIQRRVPMELMGRAMSVLMFTFLGLAPLSAAVAGVVMRYVGLGHLLAGAGLGLTVIALSCFASRNLRSIGQPHPEAAG